MNATSPATAQPVRPAAFDWSWRRISADTVILALALLWLGGLVGLRPLMVPDEGRYAGVALEMLHSGQLSVPLLDGMPYFHKPPLFYWMAALSMQVFGVHEWAARLPSLLTAWFAVAGLHLFMRRYVGAAAARMGTIVLVTMPIFYGGAQFANMDMLVAALISLCVLAGADTALRRADSRPWRAMALTTAALAALAVLAKGLIGLALPGVILALWLALRRDGRGFLALLWPPALAVFLLVGAPWFVLMQSRYPEFFHYFFVYQHFQRFAGAGFNNTEPFWFYMPIVVGMTLPWALWGLSLVNWRFWRAADDPYGARALMGIWAVAVVVFFSLPASKLVGYVLPAMPPLAALLAQAIRRLLEKDIVKARYASFSLLGACLACLIIVAGVAAVPAGRSTHTLGVQLRARMAPDDTLIMLGRYAFDLPFYARPAQPVWVVDDWDNPHYRQRDDWRKELLDASDFNPEAGQRTLVEQGALLERLCAAPPRQYWLWGNAKSLPTLLNALPQVLAYDDQRVWPLKTDDAFRARVCDEMPRSGPQ